MLVPKDGRAASPRGQLAVVVPQGGDGRNEKGGDDDGVLSPYDTSARTPYSRPSAVTDSTYSFTRRFVTGLLVPARAKNDFGGTVIKSRVNIINKTDVKCCEVIDGSRMWLANKDGSISVFDIPGRKEIRRTAQRDIVLWCMVQIRTGDVWAGFNDGCLRVLDKNTLEVKASMLRHSAPITALGHQQGSKYIFTGGADFNINQWRVKE